MTDGHATGSDSDERMSTSALADHRAVTASTVSCTLKKLDERGLIDREEAATRPDCSR
jgi:DNA-binding MarR family transcriptional regulator